MSDLLLPTPPQFHHAPELAVIALLDASLQAAVHALHAVHAPMAGASERAGARTPMDSHDIAALLIRIADELAEAISAYRYVVDRELREPPAADQLPF
jgi:hypothetical protein